MYPSLIQFQQWASQYKAIPVWMEPDLPSGDLLPWVHALLASQQKFFFLHSASNGLQSRYSYLALDTPRYHVFTENGSLVVRYQPDHGDRFESLKIGNAFHRFEEWFGHWTAPHVGALPPFWGGLVGYFGYETARYFDS